MHNPKEQGIALLYVLSILALLIAMALAFMNSSIFDQRASTLNAAGMLADQLALSTIDQVVRGIQDKPSGIDSYRYSKNSTTTSRDGLNSFETIDYYDGATPVYIFEWDSSTPDMKDASDKVQWNLHKTKINDSVERIIGRTAFILIPPLSGGGQINPGDLIQEGFNEAARPEKRRGVLAHEMNAMDINASNISFTPATAIFLNYSPLGVMPKGGWHSLDEFLNAMTNKAVISSSNFKDAKEDIQRLFSFETLKSPEQYIMKHDDISTTYDDLKNDQGNVHRFYLPGFVEQIDGTAVDLTNGNMNLWEKTDSRFVDRYILMDPSFSNKPGIDLLKIDGNYRWKDDQGAIPKDVTDPVFGAGIPWLAAFGYGTDGVENDIFKGTFDNVADRRRQIAANLKDYCDSDNSPTSDIDPTSWNLTTNVPKYTGNEKTPYLNEFETTTAFKIKSYANAGDNFVEATAEIDIKAEIINIYQGLVSSGATVDLIYTISDAKITIGWDNNTPEVHNFAITSTPVTAPQYQIQFGPWTSGVDTGHFSDGKNISTLVIPPIKAEWVSGVLPDTGKATISYTVVIEKALLEYNSIKSDYANINATFTLSQEFTFTVGEEIEDAILDSVQTEDPRQNLNIGDWNKEIEGKLKAKDAIDSNIGKINAKSNPSAPTIDGADSDPGYDLETVTTPGYSSTSSLSTAHIRNAPMLSPWELGFIHRGKKWQTLNLTKYNEDKAVNAIKIDTSYFLPGGGLYSEGDANILDQIKMTQFASSPSKINLADTQPELLDALFSFTDIVGNNSISITDKSQDVAEILGTGTTPASPFLNDVKNFINTNKAKFKTRAKLADNTHLHIGNTKAQQEELIGKAINLTEAHKDLQNFQLIILAQAIKNVGTDDGTAIARINKAYYDSSNTLQTKDITDVKLGQMNSVKKSGTNDSPDNFLIADEILAERKYIVTGVVKSNGEVQITNIRTLR
jgi:hypothetical protein